MKIVPCVDQFFLNLVYIMNTLLGYTKSYSCKPGDQIELYTHFPSSYSWVDLYAQAKPNKLVTVNSSFNSIHCIINQFTSTPGIVWKGIVVPPGSKYLTINYDISSSISIFPYVKDLSGNVLYWTNFTKNLIKSKPGSICININQSKQLDIYLMAPSGKFELGSTFLVKNISFDFSTVPNTDLSVSLFSHKKTLISKIQLDSPISQKFIPNSFAYGCGWTRPRYIQIQSGISSGYYFLKLEYKSQVHWLVVIIKPDFNLRSENKILLNKILLLANTNKYNAYNTWAGLDGSISLYTCKTTPYYLTHRILSLEGTNGTKSNSPIVANFVHTERPNTTASSYIKTYFSSDIKTFQFFNDHIYGEMHLPNYLDRLGLGFDVITDQDMEQLGESDLSGYSIFMMHVHPEYWSVKQLQVLNQINQMGMGIIYLAGNGIYWKCTWDGNQMEVRKDRKFHLDGTKGGQFKELEFSQMLNGYQIIKIYYSKMYSMALNPPVPYKLANPPSCLVQGLTSDNGLVNNQIGFKNLNSFVLISGTSGWEVDKVTSLTDIKYIVGSSPDGLGNIVWVDKTNTAGAVFAAGSIIYTGSLAVDPGISRLTLNVINRML